MPPMLDVRGSELTLKMMREAQARILADPEPVVIAVGSLAAFTAWVRREHGELLSTLAASPYLIFHGIPVRENPYVPKNRAVVMQGNARIALIEFENPEGADA